MQRRLFAALKEHRGLAVVVTALSAWYVLFLIHGTSLNLTHDELNFLFDALRLPAQRKLIGYGHGPLFYEIIAAAEVALYVVFRLTGRVASALDYLTAVLADVHVHLRIARALTAIAAIATVVQLYRIARLFGGRKAGIVAASLCATNYTFIALTSMAKEDAFSWCFTLIAMELAWRASSVRSSRLAIGCGIAIGAATAAKYFGVFGGLLAVVPLLTRDSGTLGQRVRISLIIATSAALSFFAFFPFLLTDRAAVFASITGWEQLMSAIGLKPTAPAYIFHHMPNLVGISILVIAAIEAIRQVVRDHRGPILLFVGVAVQFLFLLSRSGYSMAHYVFMAALVCFVLAGSAASALAQRIRGGGAVVAVMTIAVILLEPAYASSAVKHALRVTGPDTRLLVQDVIANAARDGDCVVINHAISNENALGPPLLPLNSISSHRPFAKALKEAQSRMEGPRYELRLVRGSDVPAEAARDCEWIVAGRFSRRLATVEVGSAVPQVSDDPRVPSDFQQVAFVPSFPEPHSVWFPFPTTLDYEELRRTPLRIVWRDRGYGLTFFVYKRSSSGRARVAGLQ